MVELVVVLALLGIVAGAVTSLVGWGFRQQAVVEQQESEQEAVHQGLSRLADLIRRAGAAGRPAIQAGAPDSIDLRGFTRPPSWAGSATVHVSLDPTGRLVATVQGGNTAVVDLVPGARFRELRFGYAAAGRGDPAPSCGSAGDSLPCARVSAVEVTLGAAGSGEEESLWVALRNPGGQ
ncbi:MAG: hypothetical protein K6U79_07810 [Firmicutes bacterium]|nr:hypothetical protein [Bacillota bacterium]